MRSVKSVLFSWSVSGATRCEVKRQPSRLSSRRSSPVLARRSGTFSPPRLLAMTRSVGLSMRPRAVPKTLSRSSLGPLGLFSIRSLRDLGTLLLLSASSSRCQRWSQGLAASLVSRISAPSPAPPSLSASHLPHQSEGWTRLSKGSVVKAELPAIQSPGLKNCVISRSLSEMPMREMEKSCCSESGRPMRKPGSKRR